jgi:hypothetical protein
MTKEKRDKLDEAILLCTIHSERMNFAWGKIKTYFPLDRPGSKVKSEASNALLLPTFRASN